MINQMIYYKITYWFLATCMFMFGILKFFNPFKGWYSIQIANSGLGQISQIVGVMGEIAVGVILFLCLIYRQKISNKAYILLTNFAFFTIIVMMMTSVYVHLHPDVPADVLPLKIKPPYIPIFFSLLALSNIYWSTLRTADNTGRKV
ncbi:hypothetical protein GCM10011418_24760 [Sphingobacterium alkalisoli]|nr:hypothetical protein GCM10011418_24760 [Sphingobacterium alkalisoli]